MTPPEVETFLVEITASLTNSFPSYSLEFLLRTPKSLKVNVHLGEGLFIAVRYNARNERTDFALIKDGKRVFGYDNLKEWHCHPNADPSLHVPCEKPSVNQIISEISRLCSKGENMTQDPELELKQNQFNAAMELYEKDGGYKIIGKMVSLVNVSLQVYLLFLVLPFSLGLPLQILSIFCAYLLADFLNGLVHMFMDSNDNYDSPAGPLIAAFHLHHKTPLYKRNNILVVYFNESGAKIWLVGYLLAAAVLIRTTSIHPVLSYIIVYVGILSSVAEVSHYCCHVMDTSITGYLRFAGIFLSKKHHGQHHLADNVNYAFLNGFTDPALNIIARKYSSGYKNTTDKHFAAYAGPGTANR